MVGGFGEGEGGVSCLVECVVWVGNAATTAVFVVAEHRLTVLPLRPLGARLRARVLVLARVMACLLARKGALSVEVPYHGWLRVGRCHPAARPIFISAFTCSLKYEGSAIPAPSLCWCVTDFHFFRCCRLAAAAAAAVLFRI